MAAGSCHVDVARRSDGLGSKRSAGYALLDPTTGRTGASAVRGRRALTMVTDTMLPEAFQTEGISTGWLVAIEFRDLDHSLRRLTISSAVISWPAFLMDR